MLTKFKALAGCTIRATDGEIGTASTVYFDDENWTVRYLVVDTGTWLPGRQVLISPISVIGVDKVGRRMDVSLTRDRVKNSPPVDTHRPVSRQYEADYLGYYGYPYYWGGAALWGAAAYPAALAVPPAVASLTHPLPAPASASARDSHLRDASVVQGHHIQATDGEIGHVEDFLIDERTWTIRYMVVDTSNWLGGAQVLIPPTAVSSVSWSEAKVFVTMTRDAVKDGPRYDEAAVSDVDEHAADARFARLDELEQLEVADGHTDVRRWKAVAADGRVIGRVEHLIVDRAALTVRYLEVSLAASAADPGAAGDVLIPLQHVDVDDARREVRVRALSAAGVQRLPRFTGFPIPDDYDLRFAACLDAGSSPGPGGPDVRLRRSESPRPDGAISASSTQGRLGSTASRDDHGSTNAH